MRKYYLLLLLVFIASSLDGDLDVVGVFTDSSCTTPYTNSVDHGSVLYVKTILSNTGSTTIPNAKLYVIDHIGDGGLRNYGNYTHKKEIISINPNSSKEICYSWPTLTSYQPGTWVGRVFFVSANNNGFNNSPYLVYVNITNTTTDYTNLTFWINFTATLANPYQIPINTPVNYTINLTNNNPYHNYKGILDLVDPNDHTFPNGSTKIDIDIPPLTTVSYNITLTPRLTSGKEIISIYVDHGSDKTKQDNIRKWYWTEVVGDYYMYQVESLYADKTIYTSGEDVTITAELKNLGTLQWNSTCCKYIFTLSYNNGTDYETIGVKKEPVSSVVNNGESLEMQTKITTTHDLYDFWVGIALEANGQIADKNWQTNITTYDGVNTEDITNTCTETVIVGEGVVKKNYTCSSSNNNVFVSVSENIIDVKGKGSTVINNWVLGTRDGDYGVYVEKENGDDIIIVTEIPKVVVLDGLLDIIYFVMSIIVLGALLAITAENKCLIRQK